jgi:hypothetical protein
MEINERARTHILESAEVEQIRTRNQNGRARDTHQLKSVEEEQIRTRKQTKQARGTHFLESAGRGISYDMETNRVGGHSLSGGHRERDKSGYRNKPRKERAPTG